MELLLRFNQQGGSIFMNERETVLVQYALLLALYGEEDTQTKEFVTKNLNNQDMFAAATQVTMMYRTIRGTYVAR